VRVRPWCEELSESMDLAPGFQPQFGLLR
jgi:hypothetical protein